MELRLEVLGTPCRVTTDDEAIGARLGALLRPFVVREHASDLPIEHAHIEVAPGGNHLRLSFRGETFTGRRSPLLSRLIAQLTSAAIDGFRGLAVHAGVVSLDGSTVVLAAESGVGKSTVTAACLMRGFDYVSDEALCVSSEDGGVVPFPKPLALGAPSAELLGLPRRRLDTKDLVPPGALGARVAVPPLSIGHVISLERSGAGSSEPEALDRSTAVSALLSMAFNAYRDPAGAVATASAVAAGASSWRLDLDDPREAAERILQLMG